MDVRRQWPGGHAPGGQEGVTPVVSGMGVEAGARPRAPGPSPCCGSAAGRWPSPCCPRPSPWCCSSAASTGHIGRAPAGTWRAGSWRRSPCSSCSPRRGVAAGRRPRPARRQPHGADRRGVGPRSLPHGARPRRPPGRPRALRDSPHPGLRQLAGGPHAPGPRPAPAESHDEIAGVPAAGPRPAVRAAAPVLVIGSPFLWWMRVAELRAVLAPVVAGTGPSAHPDIAAARRFVRGLDAAVAVTSAPGRGAPVPARRSPGSAGWPGCCCAAAAATPPRWSAGVAAAAAERAQAVDYGLRIVAQEQVGLAYAGWDRLLTRVALPAWRMGRWPSRLDAGVVAALTELSRRDRLAEGFASRLGERPACDLLEEPGAIDEAASLLAARLFHGGPAETGPGLGAGRLAASIRTRSWTASGARTPPACTASWTPWACAAPATGRGRGPGPERPDPGPACMDHLTDPAPRRPAGDRRPRTGAPRRRRPPRRTSRRDGAPARSTPAESRRLAGRAAASRPGSRAEVEPRSAARGRRRHPRRRRRTRPDHALWDDGHAPAVPAATAPYRPGVARRPRHGDGLLRRRWTPRARPRARLAGRPGPAGRRRTPRPTSAPRC